MACARSSSDERSPPSPRARSAVGLAPARVSEDHRQGHLAVAEVVADALAHGRCVRRIIDRVVDQLEGDAEVAAIAFERLLGLLAGLGDDRRDAAGGGEQRRGLGADDVEIMLFARSRSGAGRSAGRPRPRRSPRRRG